MKHKFLFGALAGAAFIACSGGAFAATDLGVLSEATPISYSQGLLADTSPFSDVYTFTLGAASNSLIGIVSSVYSDSSDKITLFSATLSGPSGSSTFDFTDLPDAGSTTGYQYLAQGYATAAAGIYTLTVNGTTAAYAGTYTIDLSVSAVPEPTTLALMFAGLGLVGVAGLRRKSV